MNTIDFIETKELNESAKAYLCAGYDSNNIRMTEPYSRYWKESGSVYEFSKKVIEDASLIKDDAYAEISRTLPRHSERLGKLFDEYHEVASKDHTLKFKAKDGTLTVVNTSVNSDTLKCKKVDKGNFNTRMMNELDTELDGEFILETADSNIYLNGQYNIYNYDNYVAIARR